MVKAGLKPKQTEEDEEGRQLAEADAIARGLVVLGAKLGAKVSELAPMADMVVTTSDGVMFKLNRGIIASGSAVIR